MEEKISAAVSGMDIAIAIDGGSSKLAHGSKVVAVLVDSPQLAYNILLEVSVLTKHEMGKSQAALLDALFEQHPGLDKRRVNYIVADNASVNGKTVKLLNKKYGWAVEYVRCLPHCLNLVV